MLGGSPVTEDLSTWEANTGALPHSAKLKTGSFSSYLSFIYSRVPLNTLYLGVDWWKHVRNLCWRLDLLTQAKTKDPNEELSACVSEGLLLCQLHIRVHDFSVLHPELDIPLIFCRGSGGLLLCQLHLSPRSWKQRSLHLKCCQCRPVGKKTKKVRFQVSSIYLSIESRSSKNCIIPFFSIGGFTGCYLQSGNAKPKRSKDETLDTNE